MTGSPRPSPDPRRRVRIVALTTLVLAAVIAVVIALTAREGDPSPTASPSAGPDADTVLRALTSIPPATIDAVGAGTSRARPAEIPGRPVLTADGRPLVLYAGAEWCPVCGIERWALVNALSRFGTVRGVELATAPKEPSIPAVATLSFRTLRYDSELLALTTVELQDAQRKPLQQPDAATDALLRRYDMSGYPFLLFGEQSVYNDGVTFTSMALAGKTHAEIVAALADPHSELTALVVGEANTLTAAMCQLTKDQPAPVCQSAGVRAAASLPAGTVTPR